MHGHEELANGGKQKRKIKEWYVFPDGRVEVCDKGQLHRLVNDYGMPIYVLSVNGIILCRKMAKKNVVFSTYFFVSQIHDIIYLC